MSGPRDLKPLTDRELKERYADTLSEIYGTVSICGHDYDAAHALKRVDPIAYRRGFSEWLDFETCDGSLVEEEAHPTRD